MAKIKRISLDDVDGYISYALSGSCRDSSSVRSRIVRELLSGGLTQRQREFLMLRYVKNMNGAEIARMYGVSRASVSITLARARKRILAMLGTQKLRDDFHEHLSEQ